MNRKKNEWPNLIMYQQPIFGGREGSIGIIMAKVASTFGSQKVKTIHVALDKTWKN